MKKIISYLLIISTILFLAGCSNDSNNTNNQNDDLPENIPEELKTELTELKGFYIIDSEGEIIIDSIKLANAKLVGTRSLSEESINKIKEFKETSPDEYEHSGADHIPDQLHFSSDGYGWEYREDKKEIYNEYNLEGAPMKWQVILYDHLLNDQIKAYGEEKTLREIQSNCKIKFIWPSINETTKQLDWTDTHSKECGFALINNLNELLIFGSIFDSSVEYVTFIRQ